MLIDKPYQFQISFIQNRLLKSKIFEGQFSIGQFPEEPAFLS